MSYFYVMVNNNHSTKESAKSLGSEKIQILKLNISFTRYLSHYFISLNLLSLTYVKGTIKRGKAS